MTTAQQPRGARVRRIGQVGLGAIWLIDAALQLQPVMFGRSFVTDVILPNAQGQPTVLAVPITWIGHQIEPHVDLFNALAASLQVLIGLGLMSRRTVKPSLAVSFIWAFAIWVFGEGLSGLLAGTANPLTGAPGAALLYIVVGLMVWPRNSSSVRGERLAWAALWLASAGLWLLPANQSPSSVHDAIGSAPAGADWLAATLRAVAHVTAGQGTPIAVTMASLSALIAVSALTGVAQRSLVVAGMVMTTVFWVVGQGFGGVFTGTATDVSTGPLLFLMGAILLQLMDGRYPSADHHRTLFPAAHQPRPLPWGTSPADWLRSSPGPTAARCSTPRRAFWEGPQPDRRLRPTAHHPPLPAVQPPSEAICGFPATTESKE